MRRATALVAPLVLAITAACGGGGPADKGQASKTQAETPVTTAPAPVIGTFPLTGMPATDRAMLTRPAVAVKIDNSAAARPQAGIDKADVVYEEYTEGITRFVVVFQSSDAPMVGPVRSVRPADPNIVRPLGGPLAFSGGSGGVVALVNSSGIRQITENDTDTLKRRSGKSAPHNLYTTTAALFAKAGAVAAPPALSPFLQPGQNYAPAGVSPATKITLSPAAGVRANYDWDATAGVWKRSTDGKPHALEGGAQIGPKNVIVEFTTYTTFAADPKVRYPEVIGSGEALVFVNGTQVKARWNKPSAGAVTTFTDAAGAPVPLAPGQTWIHLQERGSAVTVG